MRRSGQAMTLITASLLITAAFAGSGPAHAAASFPAHYAAPYLQIYNGDAGDMAADMSATGVKYYSLAFLIPQSGCTQQWEYNGDPVGAFTAQINSLKSAGGDVIISFGGAAGGEVAQTCSATRPWPPSRPRTPRCRSTTRSRWLLMACRPRNWACFRMPRTTA